MKRWRLIVGAALFLSLPSQAHAEGDAARGEAAYGSDCASCHRSVDRIVAGINSSTSDETESELDSFLSNHYAPDAATRADIIAYLKSIDQS